MSYLRQLGTLLLCVTLTSVAWGQEPEDKSPRPDEGRPERAERRDRERMREEMLEKFDADKDGQLNDEERAKAREYRRENRDDRRPRDERGERPRRGPEGRRPDGPPPSGPGPDGPGPGGPGRPLPAMRLFEEFDKDGNDQLSRDEFERLMRRMREMGPPRRGPGGPDGPPGFRRPGRSERPDAGPEGQPPRPRERGDRGPGRRPPRPPRDEDETGPPPRRPDVEAAEESPEGDAEAVPTTA